MKPDRRLGSGHKIAMVGLAVAFGVAMACLPTKGWVRDANAGGDSSGVNPGAAVAVSAPDTTFASSTSSDDRVLELPSLYAVPGLAQDGAADPDTPDAADASSGSGSDANGALTATPDDSGTTVAAAPDTPGADDNGGAAADNSSGGNAQDGSQAAASGDGQQGDGQQGDDGQQAADDQSAPAQYGTTQDYQAQQPDAENAIGGPVVVYGAPVVVGPMPYTTYGVPAYPMAPGYGYGGYAGYAGNPGVGYVNAPWGRPPATIPSAPSYASRMPSAPPVTQPPLWRGAPARFGMTPRFAGGMGMRFGGMGFRSR